MCADPLATFAMSAARLACMEVKIAPPYSLVLVHDAQVPCTPPETFDGALVAATPDCVAIGTLAEADGETTIRLVRASTTPLDVPVFHGVIAAPSGRIAVALVDGRALMEVEVEAAEALLSVWANDPSEPDLILVQVSSKES